MCDKYVKWTQTSITRHLRISHNISLQVSHFSCNKQLEPKGGRLDILRKPRFLIREFQMIVFSCCDSSQQDVIILLKVPISLL